jgi:predicted alpha/beta-hydrolase family hydrolase
MKSVTIPINSIDLEGELIIPKDCLGLVIFAHGSGSSRKSPRNTFVAQILQKSGLGTLLFDLLTEKEDEVYANRFNIPLLAERLKVATNWLKSQKEVKNLSAKGGSAFGGKIGYFGASTGAAAALIAAANLGQDIGAVVSRGGRPDLALDILSKVKAPTLLIVGGDDTEVIELNRLAYNALLSKKELSIVPGATHLFEEPGTLEQVAELAKNWFLKYLKS